MAVVVRTDLKKFEYILQGISKQVLHQATLRSTNRVATSLRAQAARKVKEKYNLPITGTSKGGQGRTPPGIKPSMEIQKARRGKTLSDIFSVIRTSTKPISLIHFVKGNKNPANQKGVTIKRRKKLRYAVQRGNVRVASRAFILSTKNSVQVFKHRDSSLMKQSIPSVWRLLEKANIKNQLEVFGRQRFEQEMQANLNFYLNKLSLKK